MADRLSLVELVIAVHDGLAGGGVAHGFGGALALGYYVAEPRATRDIDLNVSTPPSEAARLFGLLPAGVSWGERELARSVDDGQVRLWYGPRRTGIPLDIFFPQHAFHAAVQEATRERPFARPGQVLPVISAAHLTVFKALFDRPRDWVDVAAMLDAGTVDVEEALRWLVTLVGEDHPSTRRFVTLVASPRGAPAAVDAGADVAPVLDWKHLGAAD